MAVENKSSFASQGVGLVKERSWIDPDVLGTILN